MSEISIGHEAIRRVQRIRAEMKRNNTDDLASGLATELAIGAREDTAEAHAEREAARAERQDRVEMWAKEIATLEGEIEAIRTVVEGESKLMEVQKKLDGAPNETARDVYEKALVLRQQELSSIRQNLPAESYSLDTAELAAVLTQKQNDLNNAMEMRNALLDD